MLPLKVRVSDLGFEVDAALLRPDEAKWILVLAHGAGAGMHHPFMENLAHELAACRVATLRYQFPSVQQGRKRPDPPAVLTATVRAAVRRASEAASDLTLLAGGKSLDGRMTSLAFSNEQSAIKPDTPQVSGLVFLVFPCTLLIVQARNARTTWRGFGCQCCFYKVPATRWPTWPWCAPYVRRWHHKPRYMLSIRRTTLSTCCSDQDAQTLRS